MTQYCAAQYWLWLVDVARACPKITKAVVFTVVCGEWVRRYAALLQILTFQADAIKGINTLYMISDWGRNEYIQSSEAWQWNYYDVQRGNTWAATVNSIPNTLWIYSLCYAIILLFNLLTVNSLHVKPLLTLQSPVVPLRAATFNIIQKRQFTCDVTLTRIRKTLYATEKH